MDLQSAISIIITVILIYAFFKWVVKPVVKLLVGIFIFLFVLYLIQHVVNYNLHPILGPFATYLDIANWGFLNWIVQPIRDIINTIIQPFKR